MFVGPVGIEPTTHGLKEREPSKRHRLGLSPFKDLSYFGVWNNQVAVGLWWSLGRGDNGVTRLGLVLAARLD
jgi:hypothetical protein